MNILIPHTWLLEHLETDASPEEIQRLVSLSGPSIERIYNREGEPVYDIEVTTNRVDSMSVRGIGREAAVILQQASIQAQLKPAASSEIQSPTINLPLPTIENNPQFCKRIMTVVLANVQQTPTPDWMAKRLRQIDQNVHNSVIDITNYITHELGHPCHAFDYDKIMALGGVIRVVEAVPGKTFITLDGVEYETIGGEIVFENDKGEIIDLPAIKGTLNTSIDDNTQNVLFWIESLSAEKVRFGSMSHAIRTVAAQLNEKNVDPYLAESVLTRGVELYSQLTHAQVASDVYDAFPSPPQMNPVMVNTQTINNYLGIELGKDTINQILNSLECRVEWQDETTFTVVPPTFRPDITIPADVIEELARIYGYHNLPSKIMDTAIPLTKPENSYFHAENRMKQFLADLGWQEVYTYSMVSDELAQQSGYKLVEHLKLQNPLTEDRVYLRRSLLPSLQEVINSNTEQTLLSVFEIANVYHPRENQLPDEVLTLGLISQLDYRSTRGILEALLRQFYVTKVTIEPLTSNTAKIFITEAGTTTEVGEVQLQDSLIGMSLELRKVMPLLKSHPAYKPLPKAEPVKEDLTFQLPLQVAVGKVMDSIYQVSPLIQTVELKDIYNQNYTFTITYSNQQKSLSADEVEPLRKSVVENIKTVHQGTLIGSLG